MGGQADAPRACTTVERKIGRGRAEITCKNNNGREYRITRLPAFLPVIGFRIREKGREKEKGMRIKQKRSEGVRENSVDRL